MLYLIGCGKYVKIGVSARPWDRLAEFQTGNPEPLEMLAIGPGDYAFESELHRLFGEHRGVGEWFQDNERIRAVVAFMRDTFPELQVQPERRIEQPLAVNGVREGDKGDEWRIEKRSYVKRDGTTSVYHNYRSRHIERDPMTGSQRVAYRTAKHFAFIQEDYAADELPSGPRTLTELASMSTRTWRIETNANGNGSGGSTSWGWRRRGPVREYHYGGIVVDDDAAVLVEDAPPLATPAPAAGEEVS